MREAVFVSHAAPEDNEFALWLSAKLAIAGYRVWVDRRRLRGGDDFWDEIDRVLRTETIKQVVVFSRHVGKPGVKKELAIGDAMRKRLADPKFMIPIRSDDVAFDEAPPEFIRGNIINAYPNWHDCLAELFEALNDAGVPTRPQADDAALKAIVVAREDGRHFIQTQPEDALTNWFPITPPKHFYYYRFEGLQEQMKAWLKDCRIPHVPMGRLAGSFADPASFSNASSFVQKTPTEYAIDFFDFVSGKTLGPYLERGPVSNDVVNLLRQHFDALAAARGLKSVAFANGDTGWFFPDGVLPSDKIEFVLPDGRKIRRVMSGKFKSLRWHLCLLAKARIWPQLVYRIHVNLVLSEDGQTPMPGEKTHTRRRRLTRSWWNNIWRDRLLAAMHFLAAGEQVITLKAGDTVFSVSPMPLIAAVPVSYEAADAPLPSEEDDDGTIEPIAALDDRMEDTAEDEDAVGEVEDDAP
ncbi:toll/interleukin-1 receptor domain-containing protein [Bradyrhizobium sp. SZCCHNR3015]|uniref:toll/interleukin-1 receptor domain-containing protein n=1 Tax=Bradyrhizobium sp. SZCCHNR3015 TaxID=3057395 RepID=UPI002916C146|nr:toll/interleukin-1 receptor domain-containing protein [Bradyrhizobium sp. SZCCHNR3015]